MSYFKNIDINKTALGYDAWGRNKMIIDKSLFSSKFTMEIPDKDWVLPVSTVGGGVVDSYNGALRILSGTTSGDYGKLFARRHPTYQANRGHLYSTALILPDPAKLGFTRRWGAYFTDGSTFQSGVLFELTDGILRGKTYNTFNGVISEKSIVLDYSNYNIAGGALFDIQFQWRGVGDYFFYINQELVGTIENLGVADADNKLSIINPSLPPRFECINNGGTGQAEMYCGCVDITSEGGDIPQTRHAFVDRTGDISVDGTPFLIVYAPLTYKGQHNSRDINLVKASMGSDDKAIAKIILTRDPSIFGLATLGDINGETHFTFVGTSSTTIPNQSSVKFHKTATLLDLTDPTKYQLIDGSLMPKAGDDSLIEPKNVTITHGDYLILVGTKSAGGTSSTYGTLSLDEII